MLFFRFIGLCLGDPKQERYAKIFALVALLWGPLQYSWDNGLSQNHSYYVVDTSKPPIGRYANGALKHPSKFIDRPSYHYGVGYKFSLGNPVAKFIYDLFGGYGVTYVMSFVDVLILGSICSYIASRSPQRRPT
ncbi:hypothetical protein J7E24_12780 [Hymenobacter sp. ISL-91]|nr:hypothetical protein [Hymenobacter sp. ISL-91]